MRMSSHQFGGDGLDDTAEIKQARLFGHACVKDDLQQEVAEFLAQIFGCAALNCVGLFDREGRDRGEGLLNVPRAAADGIAQRRHDVDQATNVAGRLHGQGQQSEKTTKRTIGRPKGAPWPPRRSWARRFRATAKWPRGLWACPPLSS